MKENIYPKEVLWGYWDNESFAVKLKNSYPKKRVCNQT